MRQLIFSLTIIAFLSTGCSKNYVAYSSYLQEKNNWSNTEIERIQFYTSSDIVLYREAGNNQTQIVNGKIKMENGREIEEVVIKKGTPGVAVWQQKDNRYGIAFGNSDEQFLTFGPNPSKNKKYYLLASKWEQGVGTVTYNGEEYFTSPRSASTYLQVDMKSIKKIDVDRQIVKGRTIN